MWYIVLSRPVKPREELVQTLPVHRDWLNRQHHEGKAMFSGPTPDRSLGIYILRADSKQEAQGIADQDPYHAGGLREYEMLEWQVRHVMDFGEVGEASA